MAANTKAVFMPQRPVYYCNDSTSRNLKYHLDQMMNIINRCVKNSGGSNYTQLGAAIDFKINGNQPSFGLGSTWSSGTIYFQNLNYTYNEIASGIGFTVNKFFVGKFYLITGTLRVQWKELAWFDQYPL